MEIVAFVPGDRAALRRFVAVGSAVRSHDSPWQHPLTEHEADGEIRYGWDLEPSVPFLGLAAGEAVALGEYATSRYDNRHLAWLTVQVHPQHRRRGHGTALLDALVARARSEGRTSVALDGWEGPAPLGFAARHGLECRHVEVSRRQVLREVDRSALERLYAAAASRATAYDLVRMPERLPEAEIDDFVGMVAAINDAPTDELDIEDEVYSPERIRAYEETQRLRGVRVLRICARHRDTGELAGHTVVGVDGTRPHLAEQHDTAVVRAHRGHRLGLLLKLEMLRWLAEREPQVASIDTWNAESNQHMVAINEALGYRVLGRMLAFQRSV